MYFMHSLYCIDSKLITNYQCLYLCELPNRFLSSVSHCFLKSTFNLGSDRIGATPAPGSKSMLSSFPFPTLSPVVQFLRMLPIWTCILPLYFCYHQGNTARLHWYARKLERKMLRRPRKKAGGSSWKRWSINDQSRLQRLGWNYAWHCGGTQPPFAIFKRLMARLGGILRKNQYDIPGKWFEIGVGEIGEDPTSLEFKPWNTIPIPCKLERATIYAQHLSAKKRRALHKRTYYFWCIEHGADGVQRSMPLFWSWICAP